MPAAETKKHQTFLWYYFVGCSCSKVVVLRGGLRGHLSRHSGDVEQQVSEQLHGAEPARHADIDGRHRAHFNLPASCCRAFESHLILQRSSNKPCSSSGSSSAMAVSAYMLMIRWPARSAVSRTYSFSSARA